MSESIINHNDFAFESIINHNNFASESMINHNNVVSGASLKWYCFYPCNERLLRWNFHKESFITRDLFWKGWGLACF